MARTSLLWMRFLFLIGLFANSAWAIDGESSLPIAPRRYDEWDTLPTTVYSAVNGVDPNEGKWTATGGYAASTPAAHSATTPVAGKGVTPPRNPANKLDKGNKSAVKSSRPTVGSAKPGVGKAKTPAGHPVKRGSAPAAAAKKKPNK